MGCAAGAILLFVLLQHSQAHPRKTSSVDLASLFGASLLLAGVTSSVFALLQYFNLEALLAPWINVTEPGYAFGNLRQRNQFASLTNLALAVLLA